MKPVTFDPYGRRRSRWRLPRWLVLIVLGIAIGAAGLVFLQERYLGPRLSLSESNALRQSFETADAERVRLQGELSGAAKLRDAAVADKKSAEQELASSRGGVQALQDDLNSIMASLPPDPRGGPVQIRAGWLALKNGALSYDIVLSRDRSITAPIGSAMQFVVTGETMGGTPRTVTTSTVSVAINGPQQVVRGTVPLPGDFKPFQATIQIADRNGGKLLGMRVFLIK